MRCGGWYITVFGISGEDAKLTNTNFWGNPFSLKMEENNSTKKLQELEGKILKKTEAYLKQM